MGCPVSHDIIATIDHEDGIEWPIWTCTCGCGQWGTRWSA